MPAHIGICMGLPFNPKPGDTYTCPEDGRRWKAIADGAEIYWVTEDDQPS